MKETIQRCVRLTTEELVITIVPSGHYELPIDGESRLYTVIWETAHNVDSKLLSKREIEKRFKIKL